MRPEELRKGFRRANIVLAVTAPLLFGAGFLLRDAGDDVLQGLAFVYLFGVLAIFMILQARAERREERRDQ
jgi:hypothetical protein